MELILDSYTTSAVEGSSIIGGLVGANSSSITNSYASGGINGNLEVAGGLVGSSSGAINSSYWNEETSGLTTSLGGLSITSDHLLTTAGLSGWDNTSWDYLDASSYPVLKNNKASALEQSVYQVAGLLRLTAATSDSFLGGSILQSNFTSNVLQAGDILTVLDGNALAENDISREDFFVCSNENSLLNYPRNQQDEY